MRYYKTRSGWNLVLLISLLALLTTGCTSKIKGWSEESFRSSDYKVEKIRTDGLAVLPIIILSPLPEIPKDTAGTVTSAPYTPAVSDTDKDNPSGRATREAYQMILNKTLTGKLQTLRPPLKMLLPGDTQIRLNDEKLACNYRKFSEHFIQNGLDLDQLKCFGKHLKNRYIFISQAIIYEEKSEASLTVVWTFGRKSLLRSVKIYGQIWDTENGKLLWEGSGVGYHRLSAYEGSPMIEQMSSEAVDRLLTTFTL